VSKTLPPEKGHTRRLALKKEGKDKKDQIINSKQ
jgi:hypothetical protein